MTTTLEPSAALTPGVYRGVPAEKYHAINAVSATFLKRFLLDTPAHAKAMIDGKLKEESSAMSKGTALHAALLEPEMFAATYAIGPEVRRNSGEWKDFVAANPDKECLKPSENEDVLGMRDSLWNDPYCAKAIRACDQRELTIIWNDEATGILCKARIDLYSTRSKMLLDVKTTGDLSKFDRTAFDQGYDIQICHYCNALTAAGMTAKTAGFLCSEQTAPWLPEIYQPSGEMLAGGFDLITRAMQCVKDCHLSGNWPGYRTDNKARRLDVPPHRRTTTLDRGIFNV